MAQDETAARPRRRFLSFSVIVALLVGGASGFSFSDWRWRGAFKPTIALVGADISRNGGQSVVIATRDVSYRQTCAGTCDDVALSFPVYGESGYDLKITRPSGECVLCEDVYIDGDWKFGVSGGDRLGVKLRQP